MAPTITNYNLTELTNYTGNPIVKFIQYTSEKTSYLPGYAIILSVYFVIFLSLKIRGYNTASIFAACNFVNFVLVLLLYPFQIISGPVLVISIVLVPVSILMLYIID